MSPIRKMNRASRLLSWLVRNNVKTTCKILNWGKRKLCPRPSLLVTLWIVGTHTLREVAPRDWVPFFPHVQLQMRLKRLHFYGSNSLFDDNLYFLNESTYPCWNTHVGKATDRYAGRSRRESQGMCITCTSTEAQIKLPTLILRLRGDVTRSPKQGYHCPPKIKEKRRHISNLGRRLKVLYLDRTPDAYDFNSRQ